MDKQTKINHYFCQTDKLVAKNPAYSKQLEFFVLGNLEADLGHFGDITSELLISNRQPVNAKIFAKENGVVAGTEEIEWLLKKLNIKTELLKKDGEKIKKNETILKLKAPTKDILKVERTILNLIQRMSGIATTTSKIIKQCPKVLICATRKTNWGLLDKKAVVLGGGGTHRLGLYDFILIKENHLDAIKGNKEKELNKMKDKFWEIEVRNLKEAEWALQFKPSVIMLDNFSPLNLKKTIKLIQKNNPETIIEVSGGITEKNIKKFALPGVDIISLGSLTHSVKALDLSLDIL